MQEPQQPRNSNKMTPQAPVGSGSNSVISTSKVPAQAAAAQASVEESKLTGVSKYTFDPKPLHRSNFVEVWLAVSKKTGDKHIIKQFNYIDDMLPYQKEAVYQEADLLAKLKHPNIVSCIEKFE